jgi:tetratricopeptide (TPR) repeat protein
MRKLFFLFFIVLAVSCSQSSDAFVQKAKSLLKEGKPRESLEYLNKAIDKDASNAEAFNMRGVAYFELKEYQNAMMDYDQAIKIQPDQYKAYLNRALLSSFQNKADKALEDYNKALQLAPDTADLYLNRGQVLVQLDSSAAAIRDFEKATQLDPKNTQAWYNLGNTHFRNSDYEQAVLCLQKATRIDPKFGKAFYGLGLAQWETGEKELSCGSWKQAQSLGYQEAHLAIEKYCPSIQ